MRFVHHLALEREWREARETGSYRLSTLGRTLDEEGFIHASFAWQVDGVAQRFYAEVVEPLVLLTIDLSVLDSAVRLEVPPGSTEAFPHLYGPLPVEAVTSVRPYPAFRLGAASGARLHHAHIFASDLDITLDFYRRWFDAEVVADEVLLGSRNVMVAIGDGRLNIYDQAPTRPMRGGGIHHLGLQVRDLVGLVDRLRDGGVDLRKPIVDGEGFRYVMIAAPDDILLEVFESTEATMAPGAAPWFAWE